MCKVKSLLIVLFIANHFNHATTENYEKQFTYEEGKVKEFIAGETKSFLDKLNKEREEKSKDLITIDQIRNDLEVNEKNQILIDILNNFSTTLQAQNKQRREKIGYIEIDKKKYCYQITIESEKGIMFTSDTHADADTVEKIWYFFDQLKQNNEVDKLVFLGDYGDRGDYWTYTYFLLAAMAAKYGKDILFIRGNHEDINTMYNNGGMYAFEAIKKNKECANNCWDEMPLICDITWKQKKIFCSHGAMPLNKNGEWLDYEGKTELLKDPFFLANWNENIFINDPPSGIEKSFRGAGYEIPIKEIFQNMVNNEYDWSIHGHIHKNQCGILTTEKQPKQVITVVANEFYYNNNLKTPFLPAVYILNNDNPNGTFFNLLQKENDKIKNFYKEYPTNVEVLNNCVIYKYTFQIIKKINKEKKIDCNILKTICCCCDICEK